MLIQAELEAKIATELATALAGVDGVAINRAWATSAAGVVRWLEGDAVSPAMVSVAVGTPQRDVFSSGMVKFAATVALYVRIELDPQGTILANVAEKVQGAIDQWQSETAATFTRFDLTRLSIDNLVVGGGNSPAVDERDVVVTWPLTFEGSYLAAQTTPTN